MEYEMVESDALAHRTTNPSLIWHAIPEIQAGQRGRRAVLIPEETDQPHQS